MSGGPEPRTRRGLETRATLVAAARVVFERDGFLAARIADIADTAGIAIGSFYTYFKDKEEAFDAVFAEAEEEMLHPHVSEAERGQGVRASIEAAHRAYLVSYRRNARLMAVIDQVSTINEHHRRLRLKRNAAFVRRNARWIAQLQERGLADPALDANMASRALSGMVSRLAMSTYVLGEKASLEAMVATLTDLWVNALKIPPDA